jgi:hypothetical protein
MKDSPSGGASPCKNWLETMNSATAQPQIQNPKNPMMSQLRLQGMTMRSFPEISVIVIRETGGLIFAMWYSR